MTRKEFGKYLRDHRKEAGLSQMTIAKKLGYGSPQFISNCERGLCMPSLRGLKIMCDIYGMNRAMVGEDLISVYRAKIRKGLGL